MDKIELVIDRDIIEPLFELFGEVKSDILVNLENSNEKYKEFFEKLKEVFNRYPKLRSIVEDRESTALSKEEVEGLLEILVLWETVKGIQDEEIFYSGIKGGYLIFKRIGLIQE